MPHSSTAPPRPAADPTRSLVVRWMRASSRAWLGAAHLKQLFGTQPVEAAWSGYLGETIGTERIGISGSGRREVKVRLVLGGDRTLVALSSQAMATLGIPTAPPFGAEGGPGVALNGPHGAVVLPSGVCRSGPRLVLPEGVARRLGLDAGTAWEVGIPAVGESGGLVRVEVGATIREAFLVVDSPVADRLGVPGSPTTITLAAAG